MYYIINIGSNLGDRRLNLSRAMRKIAMQFGDYEISHAIETDPCGYESSHKFLNICMIFQSDLPPGEVLEKLLLIESEISPQSHRNAEGGYADRVIDIDMLAADAEVVETQTLRLPHPHLAERDFYLVPMAEIAPGWKHPLTGLTVMEMLKNLETKKDK